MNRIRLTPLAIAACLLVISTASLAVGQQRNNKRVRPPTANKNFKRREFKDEKSGAEVVYYLMTPKGYDSQKKYPLVLALHGRGGSTTAATVLGGDAMREKYPCFVMAPMSPRPSTWASPRGQSKDVKLPAVLAAMDALQKELSIDADRIYVTGQSMGGAGSFGAVAADPDRFAAAVPVCGSWLTTQAKEMAVVPFWIFHGDNDQVVPVTRSKEMVKALTESGGKPKYTEYPGVGHNSWTKAYADREMWRWLFSQRRKDS